MSQVSIAPDAPAPASSAGSRVNRPALAAAMAVGQASGLLPVCFLIGGPRIALIAVAIVVPLAVLTAFFRRTNTLSTAQPRPEHFVIAAASAAFHGGVTGYMWLGMYLLIAVIIWFLRAIFGWPDVTDVSSAALRPSMYAAVPFFIGSLTLTRRELTEQLYPDRAGVETVFETAQLSPLLIRTFTGLVLGCGVLLLAAAVLNYQMHWGIAIAMLIAILAGSVPLATLSSTEKRPLLREVTDATRKALEAAGYEVLPAPRTGDASVDPLLADLSLYVRTPGRNRAFAIDIKASPTDQPLDWSAASSLALKVSALTNIEARETGGGMSGHLDPTESSALFTIVPVLVTLTPVDSSLHDFARDHDMMVFDLAAAGRATEAGQTASSRAIVRGAAQRAPELIREFIEGRTPAAAAVTGGDGESGDAMAPA
jgi:hypothetical protein